jgi:hypothetical protein
MISAELVGHAKNTDHFAQPAAVGPEVAPETRGPPDCGPRRDRIDTAERGFADLLSRPKSIVDRFNSNRRIQLMD